jgi:dienelactone hydrolase
MGGHGKAGDSPLPQTGVTPEEVFFESAGLALKGYLYRPPVGAPAPCVVNSHGSRHRPGTWDVCRPQTAALMLSWGYAFFFPHRRGYGNSPGTPLATAVPAAPGTADHDQQIIRRLDDECDDVLAATEFLRRRADIDGTRVALSGSSRGGILSLLAAARDRRYRCAVNFSGGASQWAGHPRLKAKMLAAAHDLEVPIFLAQAENDFDTAATTDLAAELEKAGRDHLCRIYPTWGHTTWEAHLFEVHGAAVWGPDVRAFLARYLA